MMGPRSRRLLAIGTGRPARPQADLKHEVEEMAGKGTSAVRGKDQEVIRGEAPGRNCT